MQLLEIIHCCAGCNSEGDFRNLFPAIQAVCPFEYAIALLGNVAGECFAVAETVDISLPQNFSQAYVASDFIQIDTLVRRLLRTQEVQYWPDGWASHSQEREIISLCLDTNMRKGFIYGANATVLMKYSSLFCFSGPSLSRDKRTIAVLELLIPHLHLALSQIRPKTAPQVQTIPLSNRETEVLNWLQHGKSSWDISVILEVSERTVNFHVSNILHKLGVVNRAQAVAAALRLGLIDTA